MRLLVVGGTGPSGPLVVNGLLSAGHDVTIFHSGRHEADFAGQVRHIHGDPHFTDSIAGALGSQRYDCVIGMYGRMRLIAEWASAHADRFVGVSGTAGYAERADGRWGALGRPLLPDESGPWLTGPEGAPFQYKIHRAEETVLALHREGKFHACVLRPPNMYGPRQIGPEDWSFVRRILDGRRRIIIADGGLKIDARIHVRNVAAAVLLLASDPPGSRGKRFNVRDAQLYTMRQRIELIAWHMGARIELVSMPFDLARPAHPAWRWSAAHRAVDDSAIRAFGHQDVIAAADGIVDSVSWLVAHPPMQDGEEERQLGDPFDYPREDELLAEWDQTDAALRGVDYTLPGPAHRYRHPSAKDQDWFRPAVSSYDPGA